MPNTIAGPTYEEMLHPDKIERSVRQQALDARTRDALDPANLFNITWRDSDNRICYEVLPRELTGVEAPIVVLYAKDFPTGSHKSGAAYSSLVEMQVLGEANPAIHTLVWPSAGNYGIAGAWVGGRMGYNSIVTLPASSGADRVQLVESYGASVSPIPGNQPSARELDDKTRELALDPNVRVLTSSDRMGNYCFHYYVTGNTLVELAGVLKSRSIGNGKLAAYCSAMGSGGTIAAGDRLKQVWPDLKIVGLEPIQCPTLYNNGYGDHSIPGVGHKHVSWIHNVANMDALMCVDDLECRKGLQLLVEEPGIRLLVEIGVPEPLAIKLSTLFGISGVCNVLGAIKTARFYGLSRDDVVVTVCPDGVDRYRSSLANMTARYGRMDKLAAGARLESIFYSQKTDWIHEGTRDMRRQWHNLKYYTWVEQRGKTARELDAQLSQEWWMCEQARIADIDKLILAARKP